MPSLDLARARFLAVTRHELRAPLEAIGGFTEPMALAAPDSQGRAPKRSFVQFMRGEAR